jgi:ECF transporter S component (folate family)
MALLIAMHLVLTRVLVIDLGAYRISVGSVCTILAGLWLGPVAGGVCGLCADIIGCFMKGYAVNPFITVAAILWGVLPALAKPLFANRKKTGKVERPVKVLQFGEGNFLRAFVDYMIDIANEQGKFNGDIVLVKPIEFGSLDRFHDQECQYTVQLRGIVDGEPKRINRIVTSVADAVDAYGEYQKYADYAKLDSLRYIVSNTTEAGIVYDDTDRLEMEPPKSYPGKLTKFLYERYRFNRLLSRYKSSF